jgi:hypothetical protein
LKKDRTMPHYTYTRAETYNQGALTVHYYRNNADNTLAEIGELAGQWYVWAPEGAEIPEQQAEIGWQEIELTDELRAALKAASPAVRLINDQVVARIRERYTPDDEIKCLRLAPSAETEAWNEWCEECRDWGRAQKAALGL